jgi:hypothetical protein
MLQMAEVWREERVHMKLVDAKLTLENKYSQLSMLQNELEDFLCFHPGCNMEKGTVREAERLKEVICSLKINGIKEFSYKLPPPSEDIYAVFEELKQREDTAEKVIVHQEPKQQVLKRTCSWRINQADIAISLTPEMMRQKMIVDGKL